MANSKDASKPSHIFELDGVRAAAIWMVLFDHAMDGWPLPDGTLESLPLLIQIVGRYGWLGVDLFFVLSGFLITRILLDTRERPHFFRNFYARRILRIIPLYFLVITVCWLCYGTRYNAYFGASYVFLPNFYPLLNFAVPHGPGVFWSLAIEEHFYMVWPWLARWLNRPMLVFAAVAICVLDPLARWYAHNQGVDINITYSVTWYRLDGLALGALLGMWNRSRFSNAQNDFKLALGLLALVAVEVVLTIPVGALESGSPLRYNQAHLIFGAFLMGTLALRGTIWTAPLRSRFARLSGDLSYCIYLIHLSIGDFYQVMVGWLGWNVEASLGGLSALTLRSLFMVVVSFGLAMLSRRWLETPALRLKRHFAY